MLVKIENITDVLSKISCFTTEKNIPGVMFDIGANNLKVCYSDGRKTLIEEFDVQTESTDVQGKVVFDYSKLQDIISACQPSGMIIVKDVQFIFESNSVVKVKVSKMVRQSHDKEDTEGTLRVISVFEQAINWTAADANPRVAILNRANYNSIFECDNPDVWDASEFKKMLNKMSTEKGKLAYVSPNNNSAFVANLAYLGSIIIDEEAERTEHELKHTGQFNENSSNVLKKYKYPIVVNTGVSKAVGDIISKLGSDRSELYLHTTENKVCSVYTADRKFGISFEMGQATQNSVYLLSRYKSKNYMTHQLTLNKDVLSNVIRSAMAAGKLDRTSLKFGPFSQDSSLMAVKITSADSGASVKNDYEIVCTECLDPSGKITDTDLPISLKIINDIINMVDSDYIAIDIDIDENNTKILRFADIDMDARDEIMTKRMGEAGLTSANDIADEVKMMARTYYLTSMYYTLSAQ